MLAMGRNKPNSHFKMWPTPRTPSQSGGGIGLDGGSGARSMMTEQERKELCGGSLNPMWVEWLMGWPLGWTACEPLGTDKCPPLSHWLGIFSRPNNRSA